MEILAIPWWVWFCTGLILLILEMLTPGGFYILFFGLGSLATSLLAALGIVDNLAAQGILCVGVSVVALLLFRRRLVAHFQKLPPNSQVDSIAGERGTALTDIGTGADGKVELRGTAWNVRNVGDAPIAKSQKCRVEKVDGLTLHVRAE